MVGTTFQFKGLTLTVHAQVGDEYEIRTVGGYGVWFATPADLADAGVTLP